MKLIDKDILVAEIEKRYEYWREKEFNSHSIESEIRMSECQHLMLLLNTIETKEVDLEKSFELTWEDVAWIVNKVVYCKIKSTSTSEDICKDVLNQFKAYKGE